jgi:hypothetical protein
VRINDDDAKQRRDDDELGEALDRIYWLERELEILSLENQQLKKRSKRGRRGKKMADEGVMNPAAAREEKRDLIAAAKSLPPTEIFSLKPRTFDEAFRFANLIAESTLIPKEFQKNPANVLIAVQLGMELGVSPMQALQNIAVINGRPTIWGDLLPAIIYASGLMEVFDEQGDEKQATCTVKRRGFSPITRTFSMEEARRVTYWENGKQMTLADKQTYRSYGKRMLQMRARSFAMRDAFPDVLKGVAVAEDMEDLQTMQARDVTAPMRTPQPLKQEGETKADGAAGKPEAPGSDGVAKASDGGRRSDARVSDTGGATTTKEARAKKGEKPPPAEQAAGDPSPAVEVAKPTEPAEKSQEDIINECLLWIENAPVEQLNADDNWLMAQVKYLKGIDNQLKVLRPFNNRRQELNK